MARRGFSPSVRLFEAAACGVPVISDDWPGLDTLFGPGAEILVARTARDVRELLAMPDERRKQIGAAARQRFLRDHTPEQRARDLERYCHEARSVPSETAAAVVA
jgi:spore maturation protein CgeB